MQRVREALAQDPRASELGITVCISGTRLFLEGTVNTAAHREAVVAVARQAAPEFDIADDLDVVELDHGCGHEELR